MRVLLALLLVAALARAAPMQVAQAPVDLLHAERVELTERFELVRIEMARALVGSTQLDGVELSEVMTPAGTYISRGHWTYTVTLQEAGPAAAAEGAFDLTLSAPGVPLRSVRLLQDLSNPLLPEGARVSFDLGRDAPRGALFVLTLREAPRGAVVALTSALNAQLQYVWESDEGVNPTISGTLGEEMTFVITNGDGSAPHNLRILDGSDPPPTSEDVQDLGEETTLRWTPTETGSFQYECRYHASMSGTIEVE